jgi:hypothetical protein
MIAKGLTPENGAKVFAIMGAGRRRGTGSLLRPFAPPNVLLQ